MVRLLLSLVLMSLATACVQSRVNSAIQLGFEQLGSDAANRRGSYDYRTAVNVTGVSLPYSVGAMVSNPGATLPELLALPQSYGCSKIVETIYPFSGSEADVAGVSNEIEAAAAALAAQTAVQIRLQILEAAERRAGEIRAAEPDAAKAATAVEANVAVAAARRALSMETFSADAVAAKRAELRGQLAAANTRQEQATERLRALRAKPNLIVFRWSAEDTQRANVQLGSIFSGGAERSRRRTGYVVLAGVRTAALSPGADMVWATELARRHPELIDRTFGERYVTTFTLGARHVAFAEDRNWSDLLRASVNLSPEELRLLLGGDVQRLLTSQSLQLEAALASIMSASSQGAITSPQRTLWDFRMTSADARQFSSWLESTRNNGYSVIYSTRTTIEQAARGSGGRARRVDDRYLISDAVRRCVHSVLHRPGLAEAFGELTEPPDFGGDEAPRGPRITLGPAEIIANQRLAGRSSPIYFCLPAKEEYERDPFATARNVTVLESMRQSDTRGILPNCVDLSAPYDPALGGSVDLPVQVRGEGLPGSVEGRGT